jgi:DNA-binding MarR family transcriptional regulator
LRKQDARIIFRLEQNEITIMSNQEAYLRAILATVGRQAFRPEALAELVAPTAGSEKQIAAYNLCDGEHTQTEIALAAKLDRSNLSKLIAKWEGLGIVFRLSDGGESKPMHI